MFIGLQSTLAPASISITLPPFSVGRTGQSAGRDTPLILPIFKNAPVNTAPVLPAEIRPTASSSVFKISNAFTSEEFVFFLIASVGTSSFVIISSQSTTSIAFPI